MTCNAAAHLKASLTRPFRYFENIQKVVCQDAKVKAADSFSVFSKFTVPVMKLGLGLPAEQITLENTAKTIQPFVAQIELMVGLFLFFEVFTPYRNLIMLFVYWNWMKMRYQLNPYTKDTFRKFDATVSPYAMKVPVLSNVYVMIKNFMIKQSAMPQPGQQQGGLTEAFKI